MSLLGFFFTQGIEIVQNQWWEQRHAVFFWGGGARADVKTDCLSTSGAWRRCSTEAVTAWRYTRSPIPIYFVIVPFDVVFQSSRTKILRSFWTILQLRWRHYAP